MVVEALKPEMSVYRASLKEVPLFPDVSKLNTPFSRSVLKESGTIFAI
jgi:hypothetical protein